MEKRTLYEKLEEWFGDKYEKMFFVLSNGGIVIHKGKQIYKIV